eukprot:1139203-Pelagomonas_calceolata.AAC.2
MGIWRVVGHARTLLLSLSIATHPTKPPPKRPLKMKSKSGVRVGIHRWQLPYTQRTSDRNRSLPPWHSPNRVQPNGVGITNTIEMAELAAIAAAFLQGYSHIATDSLS